MENKINTKVMGDSFLLEMILNSTNDAIVIADEKGYIVKISNAYIDFLKADKRTIVGKHVSEVIENTRLCEVIKTGKAEIAKMQKIGDQNIIATRIPIIKDNKVIGVLGRVLFKNVNELNGLHSEITRIQQELSLYKDKFGNISVSKYTVKDLIGESAVMRNLKETIVRVAKGNSNVLILGESGTGKELFAHAIHAGSRRSQKPFIGVNCASIPSELMEAEFFGYEEGSFTGAKKGGKIGLFQAANKGTLFLDEIGDLPMPMQVKLLRVLQEKELRKVGSNVDESVDVRIIAATNRNLQELMSTGSFRADLYYRLNVVSISIPPLRERKEDIPLIADELIRKISERNEVFVDGIARDALQKLTNYDWPGNVRELENILERSINFLDSDRMIKSKQIKLSRSETDNHQLSGSLRIMVEESEKSIIIEALRQNNNNKTETAKHLEISRTSLYEKMQKYNIEM
ncbi:MAG: sigma-54 interaction domain-containing protein [Aminipila sp.]